MADYYVITYDGRRRAEPFDTDAQAMTALAELHRVEGSGCMDLDIEVVEGAELPDDLIG